MARFHLESLMLLSSSESIRATLKTPSKSKPYDVVYESIIERIDYQIDNYQNLARSALSWVVCAERPLTATELRYALAVEINTAKFDEKALLDIEHILSACAGLLTVDENTNLVK